MALKDFNCPESDYLDRIQKEDDAFYKFFIGNIFIIAWARRITIRAVEKAFDLCQ